MPGLAHREKKMRHAWNALRTILVFALTIGVLAMNALAAPGDQPSPTDKFKNLEFREIGPAVMGGRIDDFAVVESNPSIVYVGTASGGVWKTTNNGTTWEPVFDKQSVSTIGDIAIAPSDPAVVWVGTGEPNNRQSSSWGDAALLTDSMAADLTPQSTRPPTAAPPGKNSPKGCPTKMAVTLAASAWIFIVRIPTSSLRSCSMKRAESFAATIKGRPGRE